VTAHWVRCSGLTIGVLVDSTGLIVEAPALVQNFIGEPFGKLLEWLETFERVYDDDPDSNAT
jgi:hypothetical protein